MSVAIRNIAVVLLSALLMSISVVYADDSKVSESVKQEIIDAEKKKSEAEKSEEGEASGNIIDCEQTNESADAQDDVDNKDLDECEALIK